MELRDGGATLSLHWSACNQCPGGSQVMQEGAYGTYRRQALGCARRYSHGNPTQGPEGLRELHLMDKGKVLCIWATCRA
jgi:hypothetical protein